MQDLDILLLLTNLVTFQQLDKPKNCIVFTAAKYLSHYVEQLRHQNLNILITLKTNLLYLN